MVGGDLEGIVMAIDTDIIMDTGMDIVVGTLQDDVLATEPVTMPGGLVNYRQTPIRIVPLA